MYRLRQDSSIHKKTLSPHILSDLNKLFVSVGDLWREVADRITVKHLLKITGNALGRFVFHKLVALGVGNRKRVESREDGFKQLAATIRNLVRMGAIQFDGIQVQERLAFWLFYRFNSWRCLVLLRWMKGLFGYQY